MLFGRKCYLPRISRRDFSLWIKLMRVIQSSVFEDIPSNRAPSVHSFVLIDVGSNERFNSPDDITIRDNAFVSLSWDYPNERTAEARIHKETTRRLLFFLPLHTLTTAAKIARRRISPSAMQDLRGREAIVCMRQGAGLNVKYSRRYTPTHRRRGFPPLNT